MHLSLLAGFVKYEISVVCLIKIYLFFTVVDTYIRTYVSVPVRECMQFYTPLISNYLWENTEISYKTIGISVWKKTIKPNLQQLHMR